jgi:hypothetical protein
MKEKLSTNVWLSARPSLLKQFLERVHFYSGLCLHLWFLAVFQWLVWCGYKSKPERAHQNTMWFRVHHWFEGFVTWLLEGV